MIGSYALITVGQSIEALKRAREEKRGNYPDLEMKHSVTAYLMMAITLEGAANQIGEEKLDSWVWKRVERVDTPLKWLIISSYSGSSTFVPSGFPLQTVQKLSQIRNDIAHPKVMDLGGEITVRDSTGTIRKNVAGTELLKLGDHVIPGMNLLMDKFTYDLALEDIIKSVTAIAVLRDLMASANFKWIEQISLELTVMSQNP